MPHLVHAVNYVEDCPLAKGVVLEEHITEAEDPVPEVISLHPVWKLMILQRGNK